MSELRDAAPRGAMDAHRRLQLLLDHMPDGVLSFDHLGRVEWINPAARLMFQCSAEDTVGRPVVALIPGLAFEAGEAVPAARLLLEGRRNDGVAFPLEVGLVRLRTNDGEEVGMCVCRDLTDSQRIERMKHEFVSMVSHELRTPLTSLRGSLALLADAATFPGLPADAQRLLRLASDNSERLVHLVNDILDFEKLRAGALRVEPQDGELGALARQAVDAVEGMARSAQVELRVLAPDAALPVRVDPVRLNQVLGNLLANAIQHSPPHGSVLVALTQRSERARLTVLDQGPGVPPAFVARLFEPFEQARDPRHRRQGGTGLGLAISRALVETMHGAIGLETPRAGEGARFWIELPLAIERPSTFGALD